jgi:hypothetical protein
MQKAPPTVEPPYPKRNLQFFGIATLVLIAVIVGGFWAWTRHLSLYAILDPEYGMWAAKEALAESGCAGKIVILGDSTAVADLIPARIDARVVNLAIGGGTSIEMNFILRHIMDKGGPPVAVIFSMTPLDFIRNRVFWDRSAKFDFLRADELAEVCRKARAYGDRDIDSPPSFLQVDERLKEFLLPRRFPAFFFGSLRDSQFGKRGDINRHMYAEVLNFRGYHWFGKAAEAYAPDDDTSAVAFTRSPLLDEYLEKALGLLEARGVPIYFVASPRNEVSLRNYQPSFIHGYEDYLQWLAQKHAGFHIIGPLLASKTPDWFGDESHLNPAGAERWSASVCRMLNEENAAGAPFVPETKMLEQREAQSAAR